MRGIRQQVDSLVSLPRREIATMALGLAHRYIGGQILLFYLLANLTLYLIWQFWALPIQQIKI